MCIACPADRWAVNGAYGGALLVECLRNQATSDFKKASKRVVQMFVGTAIRHVSP